MSPRFTVAAAVLSFAMLATPGGVFAQGSTQPPDAERSDARLAHHSAQRQAATAGLPDRSPSLDTILKDLAMYDGGIESAAFWKLRDYVQARKDDETARAECETRLLAFLKTRATPVAKMAVCRQLRVIGGDGAIAALQAMLLDERSADMAVYALQQMPGAAVDKALLQSLALSKTPPSVKVAVIAALGERRVAGAVMPLSPLLAQPAFARPAAVALGSIGTDRAAQALVASYAGAQPALKPVVASSLMKCAEKARAAGNGTQALRLYETLFADPSLPVPVRKAAAMGRLAAAGADAPKMLLAQLEGPDPAMKEAAIAMVRDVIEPDRLLPVCALLPRLPERSQVELLAVLAAYPREVVLPAVLGAARSDSAAVRLASMKTLETTGDASVVPFLAETAAAARGAEQSAARSALGMLKGRAVDDAILAMLARRPPEPVQGELLLAAGDRRIFAAKNLVNSSLTSASAAVRIQALKAIRFIGTPSDIPAVLDLVVASEDDADRTEAEQTVAALARKVASPDDRGEAIEARLAVEKTPRARARLIAMLPLVGDSSTLPLLRTALADGNAEVFDAAVRALAAWPTSAARDDVLRLARDSRNETHRLLAIRGLVRIIALDRYREPEAAVFDLRQAAGFAWRAEEQRLVLGALPRFACDDALSLAQGFLREASVTAEAQAAIDKIKERLAQSRKAGTSE